MQPVSFESGVVSNDKTISTNKLIRSPSESVTQANKFKTVSEGLLLTRELEVQVGHASIKAQGDLPRIPALVVIAQADFPGTPRM